MQITLKYCIICLHKLWPIKECTIQFWPIYNELWRPPGMAWVCILFFSLYNSVYHDKKNRVVSHRRQPVASYTATLSFATMGPLFTRFTAIGYCRENRQQRAKLLSAIYFRFFAGNHRPGNTENVVVLVSFLSTIIIIFFSFTTVRLPLAME